jgi:UDP-N-acetylmuramate dehydrogenase
MSAPSGLRENVLLAPFSTLGVGGPARFFLHADSEDHLRGALEWARASGLRTFVIGGGSNILVSDHGLDGLVVRVGILGIRELAGPEPVVLEVGAGEIFDDFVARCVKGNLGGVECLSGIPGLVGATPMQNVGAYGQEVGERIVAVRVIDVATGQITSFDRAACRFSYRSSVFKEELKGARVVLTVTFALVPGKVPPIRYDELAREVARKSTRGLTSRGDDRTSIAHLREAVLSLRRSKSMVIDAADPNHRSAGSFFMNPVIEPALADEVESLAGLPMPRFAAGDRVKVPAAWLIEQAGFSKGSSSGAVGISTRHALAIVNRGGATAIEILRFAGRVRQRVRERFRIALLPEPVLLGFEDEERAILYD